MVANHQFRLVDKGEVFGFGNAEYGQLETIGDIQQINKPKHLSFTKGLGKIVDIAAGGSFCMILNGNCLLFILCEILRKIIIDDFPSE